MRVDAPTLPGVRIPSGASALLPVVTMLEGEETSRRWPIGDAALTLGRDQECDIVLADASASRRHARLRWANAGEDCAPVILVEDLESTNGTWINGERLVGARQLFEHDKVLVGSSLFGYALRIDEELQAQRRLVHRATTDTLTSLANREVFDRSLRREFERGRRYARPLSVLLLDVDDFKLVNDRYGHRTGDIVLRRIGRVLRDSVRLCDVAARYGGEELALILPETGLAGALLAAERLRRAIADTSMIPGLPLFVTVSVGVTELAPSHANADALAQAADAAMYQAKRSGKNRVMAG